MELGSTPLTALILGMQKIAGMSALVPAAASASVTVVSSPSLTCKFAVGTPFHTASAPLIRSSMLAGQLARFNLNSSAVVFQPCISDCLLTSVNAHTEPGIIAARPIN